VAQRFLVNIPFLPTVSDLTTVSHVPPTVSTHMYVEHATKTIQSPNAGNTKADKAAKDALKFDIAQFQIPYTDLKLSIKVYINYLWQTYWGSHHTSKLFETK
jgi:hypothetical protein